MARKIFRNLFGLRRSSVNTPRANARPASAFALFREAPEMVRSRRSWGSRRRSSNPPCPRAVIGGRPPCPLAADTRRSGRQQSADGRPTSPYRNDAQPPRFFVTKKSPFGSARQPGSLQPLAKTVTSNATSDFTAQVRVCRGRAGFCPARLPFWFRAAVPGRS